MLCNDLILVGQSHTLRVSEKLIDNNEHYLLLKAYGQEKRAVCIDPERGV